MRDLKENGVNLDDKVIIKICNSLFDPAKDLSTSTRDALREHGETFIANKEKDLEERLRRWILSSIVNFRFEINCKIRQQTGFQNLIDIIEATYGEIKDDESIEANPAPAKDISRFSARDRSTTFTFSDGDLSSIMLDLTRISRLSFLLSPTFHYQSLPNDNRIIHNLPKHLNEPSWMLSRREMIFSCAEQIGNELVDHLQPLVGEMKYDFVLEFLCSEVSVGNNSRNKDSNIFETELPIDSDDLKQQNSLQATPLSMDDLKTDIAYLLLDFSADTDFMLSYDDIKPNRTPILAMNNDCAEYSTVVDDGQTHTDAYSDDDRVVTPGKSQRSSPILQLKSIRRKAPSPPRSPHLDSKGMDLNFLSQLPYAMRSEARLVFALNEPKPRPRGSRCMVDWLASKKQDDSVIISQWSSSTINPTVLAELPYEIRRSIESEMKSQGESVQQRRQPKRKRGIQSFFLSARTKR